MNSNLIVFLTVVIYNICSNDVTATESKNDIAGLPFFEFHRETTNENRKKKINFIDLFADVHFLIFETMGLVDLANLIETYPQLSPLAIDIFRRKYKNNDLFLQRIYSEAEIQAQFLDSTALFETYNFEQILNILKHFGSEIHRIEISSYNIHNNESALMAQFINKYCGDSLTHLVVFPIKENTFSEFTVPFVKLQELYFQADIYLTKIKVPLLPFNQFYPNLRRLALILRPNIDYSFIDCEFPQLDHLYLSIADEAWQTGHIEELIKKNSHIRSVDLQEIPEDYIKTINKLLPHL